MQKVDIAISYYGKPYQTMVTLFSLLEHSGKFIDKLYLGVERKQPYDDAWGGVFKIKEVFEKRGIEVVFLKHYAPYLNHVKPEELAAEVVESIRYQYALQHTDKKYLLILHNDMLFRKDMLQPMLETMERSTRPLAGVGQIGQCWNCPAFFEKLCNPEKYEQYRPAQEELLALMDRHPTVRHTHNRQLVEQGHVHPLPECRLNEYVCLLNVDLYRKFTYPQGPVPPFGAVWDGSDTAAAWFRDMFNQGLRFENIYFDAYAEHAPFHATKSGHLADDNRAIYENIEAQAREYMILHYQKDEYSLEVKLKAKRLIYRKKLGKWAAKVLK